MEDRVDLSLKPSLSSYTFRPQQEPPRTQLHEVEDEGALLAMVESQAAVAISKMKASEPRMAVYILRRAYDMVETSAKSHTDVVPPSTLLAAASARLTLCVVLSSIGKHGQALSEARAAAREIDKVWRSLFLASAEQVIATKEGDVTRPAAPLRTALRTTPGWLQRAVEVAIQVRQCIAVELEYSDGDDGRQISPIATFQSNGTLPGDAESGKEAEDAQTVETLPVPKQIEMLHKEANELAHQLLPAEHPVRIRTELAFGEWQERHGGMDCASPSGSGKLRRAQSSRKLLSQMLTHTKRGMPENTKLEKQLKRGLQSDVSSPSLRSPSPAAVSRPPASALSLAASSTLGTTWRSSNGEDEFPWILHKQRHKRLPPRSTTQMVQRPDSQEDLCSPSSAAGLSSTLGSPSGASSPIGHHSLHTPPGDVFTSSLPQRHRLPQLPASASAPALMRQDSEGRANEPVDPSMQAHQHATSKIKDPFEDWRRNMANPNQMSHFRRQLMTFEGLRQLQGEQKDEARRFKNFWIKELNAEELFKDRTLFCSSGVEITRRSTRKMEEWKKKNWQVLGAGQQKQAPANAQLFAYFGLECPKSKPDMSALGKLLKASQTHGVNMDKAMRKHEEELEEQKRIQHLQRIGQWPA